MQFIIRVLKKLISSAGYQHGQKVEAESNIALVFANYIDKAVLAKVKEMVAAGNPSMNVWSEAKLGFDRIKDKADAEKTIREAVAKGV